MERKLRTLLLLALITGGLLFVCIVMRPKHADEQAQVHVLSVGQGDSVLIEAKNGTRILVDAGRGPEVLSELARVLPKGDRTIDVVIATHPDLDHIGGLPFVLARYKVGLVLFSQVESESETLGLVRQEIESQGIPTYYARRGMKFTLDSDTLVPTSFTVLFPDRPTTFWETNSASIVGRLDMGQARMLLTGDAPSSIEHFLAEVDPRSVDVDMLKVGHHGSKTSSSESFLKAVSPEYALVSAGVNNRYGHPAPEVVERLTRVGATVLSTIEEGTLSFTTDGVVWNYKTPSVRRGIVR